MPEPSTSPKRPNTSIRGTVAVTLGAILIIAVLVAGGRALSSRLARDASDATDHINTRTSEMRTDEGDASRTTRASSEASTTVRSTSSLSITVVPITEPSTTEALSTTSTTSTTTTTTTTTTTESTTESTTPPPTEAPTTTATTATPEPTPATTVPPTEPPTEPTTPAPTTPTTETPRPTIAAWKDPLEVIGAKPPVVSATAYETLFAEAELYGKVAGLYRDEPEAFKGQYVYMERYEDGQPIFLKGARSRAWPASITKILTVLILLDEVDDLDQKIEFTQEMRTGIGKTNSSRAGFAPGEVVTYRDLLYAAMLPSAGDATHAIAVDRSGSEAEFAKKMNALAKKIGMTRSNFTNSVGLHDDNQYSTAEDLAKLVRYAWENETFRTIATTGKSVTSKTDAHPDGINLRHSVLRVIDANPEPGDYKVLGGKSGYTIVGGQAWATVVRTADNEHYICITLGSRTPEGQLSSPAKDTYRMMNGIADWDHDPKSLERTPAP